MEILDGELLEILFFLFSQKNKDEEGRLRTLGDTLMFEPLKQWTYAMSLHNKPGLRVLDFCPVFDKLDYGPNMLQTDALCICILQVRWTHLFFLASCTRYSCSISSSAYAHTPPHTYPCTPSQMLAIMEQAESLNHTSQWRRANSDMEQAIRCAQNVQNQ